MTICILYLSQSPLSWFSTEGNHNNNNDANKIHLKGLTNIHLLSLKDHNSKRRRERNFSQYTIWTLSEEWQSYQRGAPSNIICILRSKLSPLSKFSALRWLKLKFYFTTNFSIDGILNRFRFQSQWTFRTIWSFGNQFQTYLFWFLSKENWIKEGWLFVVIDI